MNYFRLIHISMHDVDCLPKLGNPASGSTSLGGGTLRKSNPARLEYDVANRIVVEAEVTSIGETNGDEELYHQVEMKSLRIRYEKK